MKINEDRSQREDFGKNRLLGERACAAGFPNARSTSSRTHSLPGITPWAAAKDSSCAYSSSVSLVPTERRRGALVWLEPCEDPLEGEPGTAVGEAIRHLRSRTLILSKHGTRFQQVTRR